MQYVGMATRFARRAVTVTRILATTVVLSLTLFMTGCNSSDRIMKKQIALMNDMAEAIEKKDNDKFRRIVEELKINKEKLERLNLTPDENTRLKEKYKADLEKAFERLRTAEEKDPEFMKSMHPTPGK